MRIAQLIDSMDIGGAERIAVNYANALTKRVEFSGLVVTRREGKLKDQIVGKVNYLFLNKKITIDIKSVLKLKSYCKENTVEVIHAHGSSFFTAFLLKLVYSKIKIVWHDHNGARSGQGIEQNKALWLSSKFFGGIIVVNHSLEGWCKKNLNVKKVLYLPNFTMVNSEERLTILKGQKDKRILMLANLRNPKNHSLLINVAAKIKSKCPNWTFHIIGKDSDDLYSQNIKDMIVSKELEQTVFIYGSRYDTSHIIEQSDICVLTSTSEGLPVSLLEYGLQRKAVIFTAVGEIPRIIKNGINGFNVPSEDVELFTAALIALIDNDALRIKLGNELYKTILENNSEPVIVDQYINWLKVI